MTDDFKSYRRNNDNNSNSNGVTFKNSTGSLYADCVGDCGNALAKLIAAIVEKDLNRNSHDDRITIVNKYFEFYDSKMSKYLLQLMQKLRCNVGSVHEHALMNDLTNKNIDMYNDSWAYKLITVLIEFMNDNTKVLILQKLAQKSCRRPQVMEVFEEVEENMKEMEAKQNQETEVKQNNANTELRPRKDYYQILVQKKKHKNYKIMVDAGEELSNNEMLAVILYTGLAPVSAAFRKSHREKCISCNWRQTFTHLGSAIKKLYRVFV